MGAFFVRRPIVAIVIAIVTVLAGLVAMHGLPIAQFPEIVPPQIQVTTTYTGADAITIEQSVATPIEQQMNGVDNMHLHAVDQRQRRHDDAARSRSTSGPTSTSTTSTRRTASRRRSRTCRSRRQELRRDGQEVARLPAAHHLALLAEGHLRRALPRATTRRSTSTTRSPASRRRPDPHLRRSRLRDADLAQARIASRSLGLTVPDIVNAVQQQNTVNPAGQIGAEPAPPGTGVHLHRPRPGPARSTPRSSATSSCARTPTARWCA